MRNERLPRIMNDGQMLIKTSDVAEEIEFMAMKSCKTYFFATGSW
jgi:hypothetical protein